MTASRREVGAVLTVDCRNVEPIKLELVVYVADQIGAIPAIKSHEFVLSPIDEDDPIDIGSVIASIKEFLRSIGEQRNFAVVARQNVILIEPIGSKVMRRTDARQVGEMFSCPHCGFVTQYEVEYNAHKRIHYL